MTKHPGREVVPPNIPTRRDDPQATLLDRLSDDAVLALLGPSWQRMTPAQREVGPSPAERDELRDALDRDTAHTLDRCEVRLLELEAKAALAAGNRPRAWWLTARAGALKAS